MKAILVLEDGSVFEGISIGPAAERIGEVVLDTAVVGYQEFITDPANAGRIVVFTYPLIGNYGTAEKFYESQKAWPQGIVIKESSRIYSNWQAEGDFESFLKKEGIAAISGIDTRTVATTIRDKGEMPGIISTREFTPAKLIKKIKDYKKHRDPDFISRASVKKIAKIKAASSGPNIAVLDLGTPNSLLKQLKTLGCNITLLPYNTKETKIFELKADGLIVSSGPERDLSIPEIAGTVKKLLGKIPMLGIAVGHEIIWQAMGGKLKKMKLGHRGVNYPVRPPQSYKGDITVQNHSFVVDEKSIKNKGDFEITLRNVNDNSVEEIESRRLKFISTQYYPASPGFDETNDVFTRFLDLIKGKRPSGQKNTKPKGNLVCQSEKI